MMAGYMFFVDGEKLLLKPFGARIIVFRMLLEVALENLS